MVAGYCWDWKSKRNPEATDVNIPDFGFAMKWNLEKDGSTWIIGENSIHEIGCIHTCQGLELDYAGVIIGNDLRYENGKVVTDVTKRSRMDSSVKGIKVGRTPAQAAQLAEELIKNTYRTLLTRGMKGCYVYFCDKPLENYFRQQLELPQEKAKVVSLPEPQGPRIEREVNDDVKYIDYLPLYTLKAACGKFGEWQQAEEEGWIKTEGMGKLTSGMFIVQANGHSMEPTNQWDGIFAYSVQILWVPGSVKLSWSNIGNITILKMVAAIRSKNTAVRKNRIRKPVNGCMKE